MGVAFVSLTDNLDLTTPAGRLMFQVIAAMGEFERELIRERVRAGLCQAVSKGTRLGRKAKGKRGCREDCLLTLAGAIVGEDCSAARSRGEGTVYRLAHASAKNPIGIAPVSRYAQAAD